MIVSREFFDVNRNLKYRFRISKRSQYVYTFILLRRGSEGRVNQRESGVSTEIDEIKLLS